MSSPCWFWNDAPHAAVATSRARDVLFGARLHSPSSVHGPLDGNGQSQVSLRLGGCNVSDLSREVTWNAEADGAGVGCSGIYCGHDWFGAGGPVH